MARRAGPSTPAQECLAVCTPGLEAVTSAELVALGLRPGRPVAGGVPFRARTRQLYLAELWLRSATRVLVRMGSFRATTWSDLEHGASRLDWDAFLPIGSPATFRVTSHRSTLYHTTAVAERLVDMTGAVPAGGEDDDHVEGVQAPLRFVVRIADDRVTISADASGLPLHRRGWRQATAKAPLRETLAAAVLLDSGWRPGLALADPLCGSGTLAIEAATMARRLAPGRHRTHALARWPGFEPGTWASVTGEADAAALPAGSTPLVVARDRDAGAVEATRANAARAGVAADVDVDVAAVSALPDVLAALGTATGPAPEPGTNGSAGWVVTNPPWGGRVGGGGDLRDLYAALGGAVRASPGRWESALLVRDRALAGHTGLRLHERFRTTSGGVPVTLVSTTPPADP
jgi:putative N6-adenine-specific DNA methylase